MNSVAPQRIIAYTDNGLMFPCHIAFDKFVGARVREPGKPDRTEGFRQYRVIVEVPWDRVNVIRIDVHGWPDDVNFLFEVPGMSEGEAQQWISHINITEKPPLAQT